MSSEPGAFIMPGQQETLWIEFVTAHAERWVQSVDCNQLKNGTGGPQTFGFLIAAQSNEGQDP